ncbi:MAG: GFA family protein [Hyphomicrobiaceae bacterium]
MRPCDGAAFADVDVTFAGQTKSFTTQADSGGATAREFCPTCGGRLAFRSSHMPGLILLMAGPLDEPGATSPAVAIYGKHHVAWDYIDPNPSMVEGMLPAR